MHSMYVKDFSFPSDAKSSKGFSKGGSASKKHATGGVAVAVPVARVAPVPVARATPAAVVAKKGGAMKKGCK
jgi:hypothetical protein